jgi:hypothetical protein
MAAHLHAEAHGWPRFCERRLAQKERQPHRFPTAVDVIDRVLDKGIVIENHARISISGIDSLVRG